MESRTRLFESIIRQVAIFSSASEDDIRALARQVSQFNLEEGEYFFHEGDAARRVFILVSGRIKLCKVGFDGQQVNLRTIHPFELFGAVGSVDPGGEYPASAQALEDCNTLSIDSAAFTTLLEHHPQLSFAVMRLMTAYIRELQERYQELATQKVQQRIARVLLRLAAQSGRKMERGVLIDLPFSRQDLAEMAGTTLFTVSRVLSNFEKQGLVSTGRELVTITNPHELVRFAEGAD